MTIKQLLPLAAMAFPLFALDAASEVARVSEALNEATLAKNADAFRALVTPDFYATSRTGEFRDRATIQLGNRPADIKFEIVKTVVYGDTVIQTRKQAWTSQDGVKHSSYVNDIYVKQSGSWKLAARFGTDIPPAK